MKKRSGKSQKRTAKTKRTQERSGRVCAHNLLPINAPGSGDPLGRNHEHPDSSGDRKVAANGMGKWKKIAAAGRSRRAMQTVRGDGAAARCSIKRERQ
jgi:hypothetical protein